jgi:hypothetical protein
MPSTRSFGVRWIAPGEANAADLDVKPDQTLEYSGRPVTLNRSAQ